MTKQEAIWAVALGKRIVHESFLVNEWLQTSKKRIGYYEFENGAQCSVIGFWGWRVDPVWNDGWNVVEEK
jgi:hypothetical protein